MNNSRNWRVWVLGIVLGVSTLWVPSVASAKRLSIVCRPAEEGTIILDGMLRDWEDVSRVSVRGAQTVIRGRKHWNDTKDASFEVLCNYSKKTLYLAVDVRDEYFHCSRRRRADDHLDLRFGSKVLKVFPGDLKKIRGVVRWGRKKAKCVRMAEAKKLGGWSVELALPLAKVPGYRAGREAIPLTINFVDADWRGKVDSVISSGPARLVMAQVAAEFKTFLADMKVTSKDVRWHASADVVGDKGLERVLLFHKRVGIVGAGLPRGGYFYFDLPVKAARDIRWVKLMDLNGDRQKEIVIRYLQRGSGGRRGVVAVYRFNAVNKFVRPFAHELLKAQGAKVMENRLTFKRWRRRRHRGIDIVIDKPKAKGYTAESFHEAPASDVHGILLPWGEKKKHAFRFEGDEYSER